MEKVLYFEAQSIDDGHKGRKPFPFAIMVRNTHANGTMNTRKIGTAASKKDVKTKIRSFAEAMGAKIDPACNKALANVR